MSYHPSVLSVFTSPSIFRVATLQKVMSKSELTTAIGMMEITNAGRGVGENSTVSSPTSSHPLSFCPSTIIPFLTSTLAPFYRCSFACATFQPCSFLVLLAWAAAQSPFKRSLSSVRDLLARIPSINPSCTVSTTCSGSFMRFQPLFCWYLKGLHAAFGSRLGIVRLPLIYL